MSQNNVVVNPLYRYLMFDNKDTIKNFAEKLNISRGTLYNIITNQQEVSVDLAKKIEEITAGEIQAEWLLFPEDYEEEIRKYNLQGVI